MSLSRAEADQLKSAIWKAGGLNIHGHGNMIAKQSVIELINLYTEEMIEAINAGKHVIEYVNGPPTDG